MNTEHPNSLKSATLLSAFKAGDSTTNIHTALDMCAKNEVKVVNYTISVVLHTYKQLATVLDLTIN